MKQINKNSHPGNSKKILIVGGGIVGITLAISLQDSDYDITLIERGAQWRTIGYGIGIWPNGIDILHKLGLPEDFWNHMNPVHKGGIIGFDKTIITEISGLSVGREVIAQTVEREVLHSALIKKLSDNVKIRFNTTVQEIIQDDTKTTIVFNDGTKEEFDLVVGADGIRSAVREQVFGDYLHNYEWGVHVYWADNSSQLYDDYYLAIERGKVLLSIPCNNRRVVGFGYVMKNGVQRTCEEVLNEYRSLGTHMETLIDSLDMSQPAFSDELQFVHMKDWYCRRVLLIGDAKHGKSPISGFGTSLALEDAFYLAHQLKEYDSIDSALRSFAKHRNKMMRSINFFTYVMEKGVLAAHPIIHRIARFLPAWLPAKLLKRAIKTNAPV